MWGLQSDWNSSLRRYRHSAHVLQTLLPDIEAQIAKIQQERAETSLLRAGKKWLKFNEKSARYLARTIAGRNSSKNFKKIIHRITGVNFEDTESIQVGSYSHLLLGSLYSQTYWCKLPGWNIESYTQATLHQRCSVHFLWCHSRWYSRRI